MSNRVLGFHFIFSAYGFWLPNDPRGSWSDSVRALHLLKHGNATKVSTTRSLAGDFHDRAKRLAAKRDLKYPPVRLDGFQARAVARGFRDAMNEHDYRVHALAVLPDHVHLVMAWHRRHVDDIAAHLKSKATRAMNLEGIHPLRAFPMRGDRLPSPWARNFWCPFIWDEHHLRVAIRYVETNPMKAGLKRQNWELVEPLEGLCD